MEDGSRTTFYAEQVLHRPPVSAYYAENRKHNILLNGQAYTQSKFLGNSAASNIIGGIAVTLTNREDETYFCTLPSAVAKGLFVGTLRMELSNTSVITCRKHNLQAEFQWKEKPMWGGDYCMVSGLITQAGKKLYKVDGKWNTGFTFKAQRRELESSEMVITDLPIYPKYTLPVENQGPWESQRLWRNVTDAFRGQVPDWETINQEKTLLEDAQRAMPCHQHAGQGTTGYETKKFHLQQVEHPATGQQDELWIFDDINYEAYQEDEPARDFIALSATLPDEGRTSIEDFRAQKEAEAAAAAGQ